MQQSQLAKERRELRQAQANQLIDSIPKDLNRPWEDPLPEAGERHFAQELRSINMSTFEAGDQPQWKQKAENKTLSYGIISNKSITEQRQGLPIYKLKKELLQAKFDLGGFIRSELQSQLRITHASSASSTAPVPALLPNVAATANAAATTSTNATLPSPPRSGGTAPFARHPAVPPLTPQTPPPTAIR